MNKKILLFITLVIGLLILNGCKKRYCGNSGGVKNVEVNNNSYEIGEAIQFGQTPKDVLWIILWKAKNGVASSASSGLIDTIHGIKVNPPKKYCLYTLDSTKILREITLTKKEFFIITDYLVNNKDLSKCKLFSEKVIGKLGSLNKKSYK
ncbi:hypothetical protein AAEX28_15675 [Lentisphaerota bacterium WC36G]|nr:hypothetical protein LJT99_02435 [Lentisphaerae bacterium WC36]